MNKILESILKDETIKDIAANFARHKEFLIYGLSGSQKAVAIAAAFAKNFGFLLPVAKFILKNFFYGSYYEQNFRINSQR